MKIIMVAGKAGSGKDTFCKLAMDLYGDKIWRFAFADELKEIAQDMGWDGEKDNRGRQLLIDIGTDGRKYNKNLWVDKVADQIIDVMELGYKIDYAVITDFRYENEYNHMAYLFDKEDIITARIDRDFSSSLTTDQQADESETGLLMFPFDYIIENEGDMDYFRQGIQLMFDELNKGESDRRIINCAERKIVSNGIAGVVSGVL